MDVGKILNKMVESEKHAGLLIREPHIITMLQKTDRRNVVTQYDELVQSYLIKQLREILPDAHFFCEESAHPDTLDVEHVFIIDPIDGTMNFAHGLNCSCISCAYMHRGRIEAAAVYNPYLDEQFTAIRGNGAHCNKNEIHASDENMENILAAVGTSPYYPKETEKTFEIMRMLYDRCLDIRRSGSAVLDLCSVASGRTGIYYEGMLSFWDYAAGSLIAEEAGAVVCTPEGMKIPTDGRKSGILCGSANAVKEFFDAQQGILS